MNNRRWTPILIAIAAIPTLSTIGVVVSRKMCQSRVDTAIAEIEEMQADIDSYYRTHDDYPRTLADVGYGDRLDPWGNPYHFLNYGTFDRRKGIRNDRNLVTLNSHYDLFSAGPDGKWEECLESEVSSDDIIRARDGRFVDLAERW